MNRDRSEESLATEIGEAENPKVVGSSPACRTTYPGTYTPRWLAKDIVLLADIGSNDVVLEPSAGRGALVVEIFRRCPPRNLIAVELNEKNFIVLEALCQAYDDDRGRYIAMHNSFFRVHGLDNFKITRVIMNPPLNSIPHVCEAMNWLSPGGRLVALLDQRQAWILRDDYLAEAKLYDIDDVFEINGVPRPSSILVWNKP